MAVILPLSAPPIHCLGWLTLPFHRLRGVATAGCLLLAASSLFATPLAGDTPAEKDIPANIENLRTFAKAYGYVRFFHPSDEASEVDWNRFAVYGAREVLKSEDPQELRTTLEGLFLPIAPTVQFFPTDALDTPPSPLLSVGKYSGMEVVAWQHQGVLMGENRGYQSVRMNREGSESFGPFRVRINAEPYRGQQIKLQAAVRSEVRGDGNQAQLWLRVDRREQQWGFFDNMQDRPVTDRAWGTYVIAGDVAEDADYVVMGGFLKGAGKAWFDDFQLFTRANEDVEWRSVELENAGFEKGSVGEAPNGWRSNASGYGFTVTDDDAFAGKQSLLIESLPLFDQHPQLGERVERPIGKDLAIQVPLALPSKDGQTIRPEHASDPSELMAELESIALDDASVEDASVRYAGVIIAWNVMQHFYPYFDVVDVDWDAVLTKTLLRAAEETTPEDFLATLRSMAVGLEDGHAGAWHTALEKHGRLPFALDAVDGRLFVVGTLDPDDKEARFYFGDEILAIDGLPAEHLLEELKQTISGSPQKKTAHALRQLRRGHLGDTADVRVRRTDGTEVTFDDVAYVEKKTPESRPDPMCELRTGIHYIDLTRAPVDAVLAKVDDLAKASGIIFDMRGYPRRHSEKVLQHLSSDTLHSALWEIPQRIYPDQEKLVGFDTSHWTLEPKEPLLSARIVFLTNARAISYSESFMGIVSHYRLGEIVGQPTAGANGNNNLFQLPAGYWFGWTGMRVRQHDGSRLHGIGIQPTVHAERTVEGVRAGRDEILEKALEILDPRPSAQPL